MLIAKRDQLVREVEIYDQAISILMVLRSNQQGVEMAPTSRANQYRGKKAYEAALSYMVESNLDEISLPELTQALLGRGAYLGKDPRQHGKMIKISVKQNNNEGRKDLIVKDNMVLRSGMA